jgi:drug/metabolite transporter (DMT)-like permease
MKRITTIAMIMLASIAANAQNVQEESKAIIDKDFMRELLTNSGVLLGIFLFTTFFLTIIRTFLDSKLKNKLIEKGASETIVSQLLQPLKKDSKLEPIKWFCVLAGIGIGLTFINLFQPLGLHSLAIMSFSLAASFLGYYFFTRNSENNHS